MATTAPPASVDPADLDAYRSWAQRRVLRALVITQVFGGAGLAAGVSVGALLAEDLLGSTSGDLAEALDLPRLSGPFMLASAVYAAAGIVIAVLLRPDPLLTARQLTMTPVHLEDHGHGLDVVGLIIGLHIGAMYLPSPLTGRLVDRFTPAAMTAAGGAVLFTATLTAVAAGPNPVTLAVALVLLGLGWNLSIVGGTALVTNLTTLEDRAHTQGTVDVGVALAGAAGGLSSGAILAATSFETLGVLAAGLAAVIVLSAIRTRRPAPALG